MNIEFYIYDVGLVHFHRVRQIVHFQFRVLLCYLDLRLYKVDFNNIVTNYMTDKVKSRIPTIYRQINPRTRIYIMSLFWPHHTGIERDCDLAYDSLFAYAIEFNEINYIIQS